MNADFFSILENRSRVLGSLLCVGLDPHLSLLPSPTAESARDLCLRAVKEAAACAVAFKPNIAFFEAFGAPGWEALHLVIEAIHEQAARLGQGPIPVILDAKRGDIASTAEAYARAAFEQLNVDAITLNPYLGYDSIAPFLAWPGKGIFLLCKTSNPGSADLQDLLLQDGRPLYEHVAGMVERWEAQERIGLVVGATFPQALARVRAIAPQRWFLVPGLGAQGGELASALRHGLRADGLGLLFTVSRAILTAPSPAQAAMEWRDKIEAVRTLVQQRGRDE
uniref:Orotidine 5'-phosphate decarboxylase n=1 Tax=uncultured Chloroflexota bacterium TaxID=166587 RepID=H5SLC1_9CHLR|nr:orotidine-5-phosphate decarboxylase/orotate phosphoribosyltransferase [uncultured Chloroflexota bacterium]